MRSLLHSLPRHARLARPAFRTPILRTLSTTRPLYLKEDHSHRSGEENERLKQEQLKKQEKGEGHWHEELASTSESHVAADKHEVEDHDSHMEDLQKETAQKHEKDHPEGKAEH